jgi:exodeoxyribonuclease VII large subunit
MNRRQQRLDELAYKLASIQARSIAQLRSRVAVAESRLRSHDLRRVLASLRRERDAISARLTGAARQQIGQRRARLEQAAARLVALSPLNILERGYALVFDAAGSIVKDASKLAAGDEISARVARGTFAATVKRKS